MLTLSRASTFRFLDTGPLVHGELELVAPHASLVEEFIRTCAHPQSRAESGSIVDRRQLLEFLRVAPRGQQNGDASHGRPPSYHFWMYVRPDPRNYSPGDLRIAGTMGLRVGESEDLEMYLGHVGYHVYPFARGRHYAERACRLLFPLIRGHGLGTIWITCNPDNHPSRRTCERLGGELIDIVPLPSNHVLYQRGERTKCRYRIDL
jgi:predicted acetyltransferase